MHPKRFYFGGAYFVLYQKFVVLHIYNQGDFVWFADIKNDAVEIFNDKKSIKYKIKNCLWVEKHNKHFFLLNKYKIVCIDENANVLNKTFTVDRTSNKIILGDFIYVSGIDTGFVYKFDYSLKLLEGIKIGEHIADFVVQNNVIWALTYHENKLLLIKNLKIEKEILLELTVQNIVKKEKLYILANNGYISRIYMVAPNLKIEKFIDFNRQIGEIFIFDNKIVFSGIDYNAILTENLHLLSIKKSTGKILCKFADEPIYISQKLYKLDLINNITVPLNKEKIKENSVIVH